MQDKLLIIPEENIFYEFSIKKQRYVVFSKSTILQENDEIYFAKLDYIGNSKIIRCIESSQEYEFVINRYEQLLNEQMEEEND